MGNYSWDFIKDLPENWKDFESPDMSAISEIWKESTKRLKQSNAVKHFNARLSREWAIETGIIENLYNLEKGITEILVEKGIEASLIPHGASDKPAEEVVRLLKDQENVLTALFDFVASRRTLSTSYIKELHQAFTLHQDTVEAKTEDGKIIRIPLLKGKWKEQPNSPKRPDGSIHEYCPPEQVASEMDMLVEMHLNHAKDNISPEIEAAWLHHRFTQIHPFQDGNGRVARALTSLIFLQKNWFPLIIDRNSLDNYISALEKADGGDLFPLISLFIKKEKTAFLKALSLSESALQDNADEKMIPVYQRARDRLETREKKDIERIQERAFSHSKALEDIAYGHLEAESKTLDKKVLSVNNKYYSKAFKSDINTSDWFHRQIILIANDLNYFADTRTYSSWVRLRIQEKFQTNLLISFHGLGYKFSGMMGVSAFLEIKNKSENEVMEVTEPDTICEEVFEFSYIEPLDSIKKRFNEWLRKTIFIGINQWGQQL